MLIASVVQGHLPPLHSFRSFSAGSSRPRALLWLPFRLVVSISMFAQLVSSLTRERQAFCLFVRSSSPWVPPSSLPLPMWPHGLPTASYITSSTSKGRGSHSGFSKRSISLGWGASSTLNKLKRREPYQWVDHTTSRGKKGVQMTGLRSTRTPRGKASRVPRSITSWRNRNSLWLIV
jgi:hypothetical protein